MNKKFTKLLAALVLLAFFAVPLGMRGQTRDTKTEGFETATTGTNYQSTVTIDESSSDCSIGWEIYYGNVSTSSVITDNNSAALRLYTSNNYGYLKTTTAIEGLSEVSFKAKAATTNNALIKVNISYSTDGNTWTNLETDKTLTTSAVTYTETIPNGGKYFQIAISSNSTKPTSKNAQLTIDDVTFTYTTGGGGDTPTTYTVTYNGNGNTSGDVPVDNNEYDAEHNTVTVLGNTGSLAKTGHTFNGWNTAANGSGTSYAAGAQFTISANTTLYAQWVPNKYSYTLNVTGDSYLDEDVEIFVPNQTDWESDDQIEYGQQVTVSVVPLSGCTYTTTVTYGDNVNVSVVNDMFTMPAGDVTITVVLTPCVIWDLTTASYSSASTTLVTWSSDYVIMTNNKGNSQTNANSYLGGGDGGNYKQTRFYKDQVLSFTPVLGYAISSIEITGVSGNVAGFTENTWNNATTETSGTKITVTPINGNNPCSVIISKASYATSVKVNYEVSTLVPHDITNSIYMENGTVVASHSSAVAGATVTLTVYPAAGYYLENVGYIDVVLSATPGTSVAITQVNAGTFTFTMPDEDVTVLALFTKYSGTYYTLVNSADDLIPGRHYIIASSKDAGAAYAMGVQNGSYREQVAVDVVGNFIYGKPTGLREIVLSGDDTNLWTLYDDGTDATSQGYLYAVSGNGLKCRTDNTSNGNGKWTISITEGVATIVSQISGTDVSNTIKYNAGSSRFSCYTPSSGMSLVYLFMKADETDYELYSNTSYNNLTIGELDIYTVHSPAVLNVTTLSNEGDHENLVIEDGAQLVTSSTGVQATVEKDITAWTTGEHAGGWYFIASPVTGSIAPNTVGNLVASTATEYDLYQLDPSTAKWQNYKQHEGNAAPGFNLVNGKGYLYANQNAVSLEFAGEVLPSNTDQAVGVSTGWNLIGNPFTCNAYLSGASFYKLNSDRTAIESSTSSDAIAPCKGVIIIIKDETSSVTFSKNAPTQNAVNNGSVQIALTEANTRGNSQLDNAIVSFNEGSELPKFYFGTQNANIYIPQNDEEYAIAYSDRQGELPVNFVANQNGTYTLSISPENVDMNYLHLIDNMTGDDIDLLPLCKGGRGDSKPATYTFTAKTTDYASRFRLVFSANSCNDNDDNTPFAFVSNGEIRFVETLSETAQIQVVDMMGRVVVSRSGDVSGNVSTSGMTAGVYVIRLIDGNHVRTQKMVIE